MIYEVLAPIYNNRSIAFERYLWLDAHRFKKWDMFSDFLHNYLILFYLHFVNIITALSYGKPCTIVYKYKKVHSHKAGSIPEGEGSISPPQLEILTV